MPCRRGTLRWLHRQIQVLRGLRTTALAEHPAPSGNANLPIGGLYKKPIGRLAFPGFQKNIRRPVGSLFLFISSLPLFPETVVPGRAVRPDPESGELVRQVPAHLAPSPSGEWPLLTW